MLKLYRRHRKGCATGKRIAEETAQIRKRGESEGLSNTEIEKSVRSLNGRDERRCQCPLWVQGSLPDEKNIRESLDTRNLQKASETIHQWEASGTRKRAEAVTVAEAVAKFEDDVKARCLSDTTIKKYKHLLGQLKTFAEGAGVSTLASLDADMLSRFRNGWVGNNPLTLSKKLEKLKTFFKFCCDFNWIKENPAKPLKPPKVEQSPTLPFEEQQISDILGSIASYGNKAPANAKLNAVRMRTLALLMRYSGLRIGDAIKLTSNQIVDGKVFIYTHKTKTPVRVPLPQFVVEALEATPFTNGSHWFWSGQGKLDTAVKSWEKRFKQVFEGAGLPDAHCHQFRDTFAVGLLLANTPIEEVAALLGHSNIRVTQKHYTPWIQARQNQAELNVRRAWENDALILAEKNGTPLVHGQPGAVN